MITRIAASITLGVCVTLALLFTMQQMIATGRNVLSGPDKARFVDFVRVERAQTVETREPKAERPPEPERRPDAPRPELSTETSARLAISVGAPTVNVGAAVPGGPGAVSDGEYLPIVKVAPVYPTRALARRMEGYVVVEFTVTTNGAVKDVVVVESTAPLFEEPAIEAALRFRYKPRVIGGTPVEVVGVYNKIVFTMDQSQLAMQR